MADIAINPVTRRVQFTGNTGTGPFAFTFNILADEDIAVYKNTTLLTLTTHYSVTTNANGTGSITLVSGQALISSDVLTIIGGRDLSRTTDFVTAGDLLASSLNEQLDSLVIMTQQLDEKVGRTIKTNPGDVYTDLELPTKDNRKGTVLGFNATSGDPEVGPTIADVSSLASITADIATLADIEDGTDATDAIQTVAGISANVTTVAGISSNITTVAGNTSNINAVAADATDIGTVAGSISNVNTVAGIDSNITTVAGNTTNINTVAGISSNVTTVAGISANVTTVAGISSDVTTVAGISSDVTTVAADGTDIGTVATNIADVNTVASNIATISAKVSKSGDTMTGDLTIQGNLTVSGTTITVDSATAQTIDLGDNDKIRLGDGDDLQIYHDGSNSYVEDTATGNLYLKTNGTNIAMFGGTEIMAVFAKDDAVSLYHNGSSKLATTSTGIDVTGTVTADGLTVDTNTLHVDATNNRVGVGNLLPQNKLSVGAFSDASVSVSINSTSTGFGTLRFNDDASESGQGRIFYDHTNNALGFTVNSSERMRITSAGNVGIGTSSPSFNSGTGLEISRSGTASLRVERTGATASSGEFFAGNGQVVVNSVSNTPLIFRTNNTDRMRIDSSGNVLVGKTSTSFSTAGFRASPSGFIQPVADGASTANFNRLTSDGDIVDFRKDGTTVGTIGVKNSTSGFYIKSDKADLILETTGGYLYLDANDFSPSTTYNGTHDLGRSTARFKDLYLSGSAYTPVVQGFGDEAGLTFGGALVAPRKNNAAANGTVDLGTSSARFKDLYLSGGVLNGSTTSQLYLQGGSSASNGSGILLNGGSHPFTPNSTIFRNGSSETMRIDSSGNLLVGKTSGALGTAGSAFYNYGLVESVRDGNKVMTLNRLTSDGTIIDFRKDGTTVGSIASVSGGMQIYATGVNNTGWTFGDGSAVLPMKNSALSDNFVDLGSLSYRMDDIYATNGTIQTSDQNEKQDIAELSDAEQRVAVAAKGLLRKFRWRDAVEEKGDEARTHFGIIAQDLQAAFAAEGLDAGDYAMFIHTTWTDEETGEERSRMGVRYSELLAFIIAAI